MALRKKAGIKLLPLIVWEPRPSSCTLENWEAFFEAVKMVDVFSPNHIEFAKIFGASLPELLDKPVLESYASEFVRSGIGKSGQGVVVIRAGAEGCLVAAENQVAQWIPSFYSVCGETATHKIVDPTGA